MLFFIIYFVKTKGKFISYKKSLNMFFVHMNHFNFENLEINGGEQQLEFLVD